MIYSETERFFSLTTKRGDLRGVIHFPKNFSPYDKYGCIIVNYGLNGNRCDFHRILVEFARMVQKYGYFCVRYDYYGLGMSDGYFCESSVETKSEDSWEVFSYFVKDRNIDNSLIFNLSFSDGAQISIYTAKKFGGDYKGQHLIFWSPIILNFPDTESSGRLVRPRRHKATERAVVPFLGLWMSLDYIKQRNDTDFAGMAKDVIDVASSVGCIYSKGDRRSGLTVDFLKSCSDISFYCVEGDHCFCNPYVRESILHLTLRHILNTTRKKHG